MEKQTLLSHLLRGDTDIYCYLNRNTARTVEKDDEVIYKFDLSLPPHKVVIASKSPPTTEQIEEMHENFNRLYPMSESTERCIINCFKNLELELVEYGSPKFLYMAWRESMD